MARRCLRRIAQRDHVVLTGTSSGSVSRGVTLVEILVSIAIVGTLIALLLPAVNGARAVARRTDCANRLRQLGVAQNAFEGIRGHYPGYANREKLQSGGVLGQAASWMSATLPFMEEEAFAKHEFDLTILPLALCPDDRINITPPELNYPTSYVANAGVPDRRSVSRAIRTDYRANGVYHQLFLAPNNGSPKGAFERKELRVSAAYVSSHDGTAKTLLLSENVDANNFRFPEELWSCFLWTADGTVLRVNELRGRHPDGKFRSIDADTDDFSYQRYNLKYNRPSSYHVGNGVNACFCDGHINFVTDDIDYGVYVQLLTPFGARSVADVRTGAAAPDEFRNAGSPSQAEQESSRW